MEKSIYTLVFKMGLKIAFFSLIPFSLWNLDLYIFHDSVFLGSSIYSIIGIFIITSLLAFLLSYKFVKNIIVLYEWTTKLDQGIKAPFPIVFKEDDILSELALKIDKFYDLAQKSEIIQTSSSYIKKDSSFQNNSSSINTKMFETLQKTEQKIAEQVEDYQKLVIRLDSLTDIKQNVSVKMNELSDISEETENTIRSISIAAEELLFSVSQINQQVINSTSIAIQAAKAAKEADGRVFGLDQTASRISDVVLLIQDIANQTHLLALNATIEAARAGDAGKGFAVVASEVKNLANETAKATDEISNQVSDIQLSTKETVEAIKLISTIIYDVNNISNSISDAVDLQTQAAKTMVLSIDHALKSSSHMGHGLKNINNQKIEQTLIDEVNTIAKNLKNKYESISSTK